mmetsp:Transcript_53559/g.148932  ORF Transcript_53559/g.148932 Transcript_53559/m.148932 type:complete len:585 (+) Transcript_53559:127-1881(+)
MSPARTTETPLLVRILVLTSIASAVGISDARWLRTLPLESEATSSTEKASAIASISASLESGDVAAVRAAAIAGEAAGLQAHELAKAFKFLNDYQSTLKAEPTRAGTAESVATSSFGQPHVGQATTPPLAGASVVTFPAYGLAETGQPGPSVTSPVAAPQAPTAGVGWSNNLATGPNTDWSRVTTFVSGLLGRRASEIAAVSAMVEGSPSAECYGMDCSWTAERSCPGQPQGSRGSAFSDGTLRYACCCLEAMWKTPSPPPPPTPEAAASSSPLAPPPPAAFPVAPPAPIASIDGIGGGLRDTSSAALLGGTTLAHTAAKEPSNASVLVAVHSEVGGDHEERRTAFRKTWHVAGMGKAFLMKFAVCRPEDRTLNAALEAEHSSHGDLFVIDCLKGSSYGGAAWKQLAVMKTYKAKYSKRTYLMQVNDDTFVAWHKLRASIDVDSDEVAVRSYIGVPAVRGADVPYRYMQRTGFLLGRTLVDDILNRGFAHSATMPSDDEGLSLGMWVDMVNRTGDAVNYVWLPGEGNDERFDPCGKRWEDCPFFFQRLTNNGSVDLQCLRRLDSAEDPNRLVDKCFAQCRGLMR